MGPRKPPGVSYESWVDRQVREAAERGAFEGLSAAGKPLDPVLLRPSAGEWAVEWARREGADMTAALPPALALRRERAELVDAVPGEPSEGAVRAAVEHFNERLDAAYRRAPEVPPVALAFVEVERQVERWREAHPQGTGEPTGAGAGGGARRGAGGGAEDGSEDRPWWSRGLPRRSRRSRRPPGASSGA